MKLTKIRAVGPTIVDFPLEFAEPEGPYLLKGVDGLNPVAVDVLDNGERRPQQREVVMLIGLQPDYYDGQTSEELRTELYGLLTPKGKSKPILRMMNGNTHIAYAQGNVTKMEAGLFTQDPEVQITFSCLSPTRSYLLSPSTITQAPAIPAPVGGLTTVEVENIGDAPSGFKIGIEFTDVVDLVDGVVITDGIVNGQSMRVNKAFVAGERLIIDTREGKRGIWSVAPSPATATIARINEFDEDSDWMTFFKGTNQLVINQPFTWYDNGVQHTPAYWGV